MTRDKRKSSGLLALALLLLMSGFVIVLMIVLGLLKSTFLLNGLAFLLSNAGLWIGVAAGTHIATGRKHSKEK